MTVIIAIAVKPSKIEKPYFLMASDSKRVLMQENENGEWALIQTDEDFKKIHMIGDRVIGLAGKFDDFFINELITKLSDTKLEFKEFVKLAYNLTKNYIENSSFEFSRCNIIIGENRNLRPKLAQFLVVKGEISKSKINIAEPELDNAVPLNIGNVDGMDDLFEQFQTRVRNAVNLNSYVVKKAAKEYVENVAHRKPEVCNKEVQIIKI